ncbi:hypothetical protein ACJ5NV_13625 [Loktanella agnita]|uniref:hypothetical protein n=1 Tax=Loktanella agnita TaxID=287097 RepID=UPI003985CEF9
MTAKVTITLAFDGASDPVPVRSMRLDRGLAHPVGRATLDLPRGVTAPDPGAAVSLGVVQGDTSLTLLGGTIAWRGVGLDATRISILEPAAALMQTMAAKSYANTTAGQMISDLCSIAEVQTGMILPGATIPHMVLRSDRTMLDHAMRLAHMSGLALTSDTSGALGALAINLPIPGAPPALNRAALVSEDAENSHIPPANRMVGAGALGSVGPGASTLPLADTSLISAGSADAPATTRVAAIRTLVDATQAQLAAKQRQAATISGLCLTTPLPEDLSPGDVVLLPGDNGLPIRMARLETLAVSFSAQNGLLGHYHFSDLEAA